MYCGICVDVCPFDALFWSPEFEYAETDIRDLTHERDKLREWMWTVPEPPALDPHSEEPKEVTAARRTAARESGPGRPARDGQERRDGQDRPDRPDRRDRQDGQDATEEDGT
jgi:NADH-quinone oxidoreductase subunit I